MPMDSISDMEEEDSAYFSAWDYSIFGSMLVISALIGIYFAFFAKQKQDNTEEYLMGGKTIGVFPISMSLIASNISGISLMGLPSEVYSYGTLISLAVVAEPLAYTFCAIVILPVLYNLKITSSYEYLELRYNKTLRKLGSVLYLVGNMLYLPIVIYVPALAFSQISGISLSILIPLVCAVCTFYTTLGGLKAVVWTDTLQTVIMLTGVTIVAITGTNHVGGVSEVWNKNEDTGRIEFMNMSSDVTMRHTTWAVLLSKFFTNLSTCAVNQSMVQRYLAMPTLRKAQIGIYIMTLGVMFLISFSCYTGLVIYAAFHDCDPVSVGHVRKYDGIVPFFVMKFTRHIPALPGIFMAGVFSAALSTMSTCQNSMCGVMFEDFIRPNLREPISELRCSFYMKVIVVVIGIITTVLSCVVDKLGGIIQTSGSLSSITMGTLLGIFLLGMFSPHINSTGALSGGIVGSLVVAWVTFGTQYAISRNQITFPKKPFNVEGCDNSTLAEYFIRLNESLSTPILVQEPAFPLYNMTYLLYAPCGVLICVTVAIIVSWITGFQDLSQIDGKMLAPHIRRFYHTKDKIEEMKHELEDLNTTGSMYNNQNEAK